MSTVAANALTALWRTPRGHTADNGESSLRFIRVDYSNFNSGMYTLRSPTFCNDATKHSMLNLTASASCWSQCIILFIFRLSSNQKMHSKIVTSWWSHRWHVRQVGLMCVWTLSAICAASLNQLLRARGLMSIHFT